MVHGGDELLFCRARIEATLNHNTGGTWTFVRTMGAQTAFTFSAAGGLTQLADPAGATLTSSSYSPGTGQTACPAANTCSAWTSSASGRELALAVNSAGRLTSVFDANSSLAASFAYSGSGCTSWGGGRTPELCRATDPGGLTSTFTYDSANSTASLDYDLSPPPRRGRQRPPRTPSTPSGRVTQQTDPSGSVTAFVLRRHQLELPGRDHHRHRFPAGNGDRQTAERDRRPVFGERPRRADHRLGHRDSGGAVST